MTIMKDNAVRFIVFLFLCLLLTMIYSSCHHTDEPEQKAAVRLTAVDTGVVDARIRVQVSNVNVPYTVTVTRDGQTIFADAHSPADTTIADTALLPKHTYSYKAYLSGGVLITNDSSNTLSVTTMDTTSHDITWHMYTLGDGASSLLKDVCIINDTCIWAVGEVRLRDSSGQWDTKPYGAAYWNGTTWTLIKVPYHDFGTTVTYPGPLRAVFAFSPTSVYVAAYANLLKWDGHSWQEKAFVMTALSFNGQINKIWGIAENQIYMVGNGGAIYYYNGMNVKTLQSGTTLDIQDIWGAQDRNGNWEILAAAGNYYVSNQRKIFSIKGTTVTPLSDSGINWALNSIWFMPGSQYWMAGDGVWEKRFSTNFSLWSQQFVTSYTTSRVRGSGINDIFICGAYGDLVHFNGVSWHSYHDETQILDGAYLSVAVNGKLIVAVGGENPLASVALGTRR